MKTLRYLSVIPAALLLCCCINGEHAASVKTDSDKTVKITGAIKNRNRYPNAKTVRLNLPGLTGESFRYESPIEEDGSFHFKFDLAQPQDASITTYVEFLYLYPGDSLHIELDFNNLLHVRFSGGDAAKRNGDFQKYILATGFRENNMHLGTDDEKNLSVKEIRKQLDEQKKALYEKRDAFLKKNEVCMEVVKLSESMIEFAYYEAFIHAMIARKMTFNKDYINPDELMSEINGKITPYFSGKYFSTANFKFISSGFYGMHFLTIGDTGLKSFTFKASRNKTVRDFIRASQASHALASKNLKLYKELYPRVKKKYLADRLKNEYGMVTDRIRNAENISASITDAPLPDFPSVKMDNDINPVNEIIKREKGKVHVIDIGATWCAPCIIDLSAYRKLSEKFEGQEVVFSFIWLGGDEQKFYEYLERNGLENFPHHFCTKEESRFLTKILSISSIPVGILINRKGIIVDHGSYVRPVGNLLEEKIEILLKQDNLL
jgi:thiol-disulfide isomerase/thioredoxin